MERQKLKSLFESLKPVKLVYLFGSRATGETGPLSDYDFAFCLEEKNSKKRGELKLTLLAELSKILKTDHVDVVILNDDVGPELKYNILKGGQLIYEVEPYRVLMEPQILNEYFDFHYTLSQYALTRA